MAGSLLPVATVVVILIFVHETFGAEGVGPAQLQMKFVEKCKWTLPTFIESKTRIVQRRNKALFTLNATFPYKFSDQVGYQINADVKRSGAWIPNFARKSGKSICSGVKGAEIGLFTKIAKSLGAKTLDCPLPSGQITVVDHELDVNQVQRAFIGDILPYGEFRIHFNLTHKGEVGWCYIYHIETIPKQTSKKG